MYTKNAKYKQVLKCSHIENDILKRICQDFSICERYTQLVRADFYWNKIQGLIVILDTLEKGSVLQWYKGYKKYNNSLFLGELIWSWN